MRMHSLGIMVIMVMGAMVSISYATQPKFHHFHHHQ